MATKKAMGDPAWQDEKALATLQKEADELHTVGQLEEFARNHPSSIVGLLIVPAIAFFSEDCRKEDGRLDRKMIKERQRMGLKFRLTPEQKLTSEICSAISTWIVFPGKGHDIGISFAEAMLSQQMAKVSDPRSYVHNLIRMIRERFEGKV